LCFSVVHMALRSKLLRVVSLALLVKIASAPLNYLMLVALARAMDLEGYGVFAFGFSTALTLAQVALMGQQQLVLRVLPAHRDPEHAPVWKAALAYSLRHVVRAGLLLSLAMGGYGLRRAEDKALIAGALLVLPLAFAEYQSSVQRAQDRILIAMVPRDILWRLSVIALAGLVILGVLPQFAPVTAFVLCAATLALWLLVQAVLDPATRYVSAIRGGGTPDRAAWWSMSRHFWLASVVTVAGPNLAVVAIGLVLEPAQTAPFFAALKTAQLMTLLLLASNLAATPMISRHYSQGEYGAVRQICQTVSATAGGFALLGLLVFSAAGGLALGLFGAGYAVSKPELMVLSVGFAISAAGGPNGILMQMAGQERAFARLSLAWNGLSVLVMLPAVWAFGTLGAAWAVSLATIAWNVHAWILCRRRIGVDPSMLGFFLQSPRAAEKGI